MKKFIITEEERKRILNLYEKVGEPLTNGLNSQKAEVTKKYAQALNKIYGTDLKTATTGDWQDQEYNNTLKKFMEEKGITPWICKTGDGYCGDGDDGIVTVNGIENLKKLDLALGIDPKTILNQPTDDKINTTNDKGYDYKLSGEKYYYSPKGKNNWVEATGKGLESIKQNVKFT